MSNPIITSPNVNPNVASVDNNIAQGIIANFYGTSWDFTNYVDGDINTSTALSLINIPGSIQYPTYSPSGAAVRKSSVSVNSIMLQQNRFAHVVGLGKGLLEGSADDLAAVYMAQLNSIGNGDYAKSFLQREAVKSLIKNTARPYFDGQNFFSSAHPVNPNNRTQVAITTGSATYSNVFTSKPFNTVNLLNAIVTARQLCWDDGQPIKTNNFTIFAAPSLEPLILHTLKSEFLGFSSAFASSDTSSTQSNPVKTLQNEGKTTINFVIMPEYPVTSGGGVATDWYIATGFRPPWALKINRQPEFVPRFDPRDENMFVRDELEALFQVTFAVDLIHPLSMMKFSA
jgi:hypothetical protein